MDRVTFEKFRRLVFAKSGISLKENKEAMVVARVGKRMRALGMEDHKTYFNYVSADKSGEELVALLDVISTNVTHFFREDTHFTYLKKVVNSWIDSGQREFRIWSAACSTGEEPYSIAITLGDFLDDLLDLKILATDISTRVLEVAERGIYEKKHVAKIPLSLLNKFFSKGFGKAEGYYKVKKNISNLVAFRRLNLSAMPYPLHGPLDVIFCRNVMIYFENELRQRILNNMYRLLKPGGYLMVGHAESLTGMMSEFKNVVPAVYIKGSDR